MSTPWMLAEGASSRSMKDCTASIAAEERNGVRSSGTPRRLAASNSSAGTSSPLVMTMQAGSMAMKVSMPCRASCGGKLARYDNSVAPRI